jgi:CII-binding regulator of phage lambda lysogenization HflD
MTKVNISDQATALAGLLQAVNLVEQLAKTGNVKESELKTCIESLFLSIQIQWTIYMEEPN